MGDFAGDGISAPEIAVAGAINAARVGPALTVDQTLTAIANRKAIDLVANFANSAAASALSHTDSTWAATWSNGNDFTQQFRGTFRILLGPDTAASQYAMFVVASQATSASAVLAQLQTQSAFAAASANAAFDTIGIAEYAGVWVVVLADRVAGYTTQAPSADNLASFTDYGSQNSDVMYAGTRAAQLYGLDGDDQLVGGAAPMRCSAATATTRSSGMHRTTSPTFSAEMGPNTLRIINQAAPVSFNLVSHEFERANLLTDDTTGQWWSLTSDYYNTNWQRTNSDISQMTGALYK